MLNACVFALEPLGVEINLRFYRRKKKSFSMSKSTVYKGLHRVTV